MLIYIDGNNAHVHIYSIYILYTHIIAWFHAHWFLTPLLSETSLVQDGCWSGGGHHFWRSRRGAGPPGGETLRHAALQLLGSWWPIQRQRRPDPGVHGRSAGGSGDRKGLESGLQSRRMATTHDPHQNDAGWIMKNQVSVKAGETWWNQMFLFPSMILFPYMFSFLKSFSSQFHVSSRLSVSSCFHEISWFWLGRMVSIYTYIYIVAYFWF